MLTVTLSFNAQRKQAQVQTIFLHAAPSVSAQEHRAQHPSAKLAVVQHESLVGVLVFSSLWFWGYYRKKGSFGAKPACSK
jgi:hypothetical protein